MKILAMFTGVVIMFAIAGIFSAHVKVVSSFYGGYISGSGMYFAYLVYEHYTRIKGTKTIHFANGKTIRVEPFIAKEISNKLSNVSAPKEYITFVNDKGEIVKIIRITDILYIK